MVPLGLPLTPALCMLSLALGFCGHVSLHSPNRANPAASLGSQSGLVHGGLKPAPRTLCRTLLRHGRTRRADGAAVPRRPTSEVAPAWALPLLALRRLLVLGSQLSGHPAEETLPPASDFVIRVNE